MNTIKIIRRTVAMAIIFFAVIVSGCKKDNALEPSGSGSFDERIIGTWQHQEILGSGDVTQTSVVELTFNSDGSGIQETFSVGPFGTTARETTAYNWSAKSGNQLHFAFDGGTNDAKYTITDAGDAAGITFSGASRVVYSRLN